MQCRVAHGEAGGTEFTASFALSNCFLLCFLLVFGIKSIKKPAGNNAPVRVPSGQWAATVNTEVDICLGGSRPGCDDLDGGWRAMADRLRRARTGV